MADKQIIIEDYFNIMRDDYGRIYCIQDIGDSTELIKAIREQNEYIQRKEQELQEAMDNYVKLDIQRVKEYNELVDLYKAKEQECEELKQGYSELTEIASPYMDDFTGYNEELGGFDIVLCVKQLLEQLKQLKAENEDLKKSILQEWPNCGEEYLNYKGVELYYENNDLKQTLTEIKEIAEAYGYWTPVGGYKQILQKISECEVLND